MVNIRRLLERMTKAAPRTTRRRKKAAEKNDRPAARSRGGRGGPRSRAHHSSDSSDEDEGGNTARAKPSLKSNDDDDEDDEDDDSRSTPPKKKNKAPRVSTSPSSGDCQLVTEEMARLQRENEALKRDRRKNLTLLELQDKKLRCLAAEKAATLHRASRAKEKKRWMRRNIGKRNSAAQQCIDTLVERCFKGGMVMVVVDEGALEYDAEQEYSISGMFFTMCDEMKVDLENMDEEEFWNEGGGARKAFMYKMSQTKNLLQQDVRRVVFGVF